MSFELSPKMYRFQLAWFVSQFQLSASHSMTTSTVKQNAPSERTFTLAQTLTHTKINKLWLALRFVCVAAAAQIFH